MKLAVVLGWILIVLALPAACWGASTAPRPEDLTVVVVRSSSLDWPEASRSVQAELSATGFRVQEQESLAETPGQLIDELRRVAPEVRGSVAVFEESNEARAYVWLPERETLFEVDVPADAGRLSADVLALRIVELLRVRLLDEPKQALPPPEQRPRRVATVWAAGGALLVPDASTPPLQLGLGITLGALEPLQFDVSGLLSVDTGSVETRAGSIQFGASTLTAHALWQAVGSEPFVLSIGAGGGILAFDGSAEGASPFTGRNESATLGLLSLRTRAQLNLDGLALLLMIEPGLTLPKVSVTDDRGEVFAFGRPLILLTAGVGWNQ